MYGFSSLRGGTNKTKMLLIAALIVVVAVVVVASVVFMQKKAGSAPEAPNPKGDNAAVTARIIKKVGKIYDLPTTEEPTVAAIQDRSKLNGQQFFDKAKNGDYLLVYTNAKLALLYREDTGKLINVGPVSMQDTEKQGSGATTQQPTAP